MITVTSLYHHSSATYKPPSKRSEHQFPPRPTLEKGGIEIVLPRSNINYPTLGVVEIDAQGKAFRTRLLPLSPRTYNPHTPSDVAARLLSSSV